MNKRHGRGRSRNRGGSVLVAYVLSPILRPWENLQSRRYRSQVDEAEVYAKSDHRCSTISTSSRPRYSRRSWVDEVQMALHALWHRIGHRTKRSQSGRLVRIFVELCIQQVICLGHRNLDPEPISRRRDCLRRNVVLGQPCLHRLYALRPRSDEGVHLSTSLMNAACQGRV